MAAAANKLANRIKSGQCLWSRALHRLETQPGGSSMTVSANNLSRRRFIQGSVGIGAVAATSITGIRAAKAAPVELRYFYRAPWPSSEHACPVDAYTPQG